MRHVARMIGLLLIAGLSTAGHAGAPAARWVAAWGSAQLRAEGPDAAAIDAAMPVTIRQIVRLTAGGTTVRVRLSNVAGDRALMIGGASIAHAIGPAHASVENALPLTFGGRRTVVLPPGSERYSDALAFPVTADHDIAVSLYLPGPVFPHTGHPGAHATAFLAPGNQADHDELAGTRPIGGWWNLAEVDVAGGDARGAVVAIGDSITDGHGIADDSNARWPDVLARRLSADPAGAGLSVVNTGIGGNRVLLDGIGPSLVARFDRDVIRVTGVRTAIVLEGINDLGVLSRDHPVDAAQHRAMVAAITAVYRRMVARAHARGIRVIGGTILPDGGNAYYHPDAASEADRQAINRFVRTAGVFDGVIDFDRALRDPAHPDRLLPAYDSGDHLHPGTAGYRAMAEAVPLALLDRVDTIPEKPQIALTFDDLPAHGPLPPGGDRLAVARAIIAALAAHRAPAFGFMNAAFGAGDPDAPKVLAAWRDAGLPLGNHTFHHLNLDKVGPAAFLADVRANEAPLAAAAGQGDWHWFRYPFLAEGRDQATTAAVRAGLRQGGYRVAAVTMSFGDYAWNDAYARCAAKHDAGAIATLEASYLAAARAQALRSRTLARDALGRDIPYVLLMHLGAFDARMLPRLLSLYEALGFGFTTLPLAERDRFYAAATDLTLPGPSPTLESAATTAGIPVPANAPVPDAQLCR